MSCDSPYLGLVVFIPLDELCREGEAFANGDLERGDAVVVVDEARGDIVFVNIEVLLFTSLHGSLQTVFGVVNASTHSCTVSFPGEFAELDGGDETRNDLPEAFGGDFAVGGQGGKDSVR